MPLSITKCKSVEANMVHSAGGFPGIKDSEEWVPRSQKTKCRVAELHFSSPRRPLGLILNVSQVGQLLFEGESIYLFQYI